MGTTTRRAGALAVLGTTLALGSWVPGAQAATKKCGTEKARSDGRITNVRATATSCSRGKDVAGKWYRQQAARKQSTRVVSGKRTWRCRVTQKATGSDPGFVARTKVRCARKGMVIRFELRS